MPESDKKKQLVDFLDRKAFEPVLRADPSDYSSQSDKDKLKDVQQSTRSEQHRFREEYSSAKEVYDNYRDDLNSEPAQKIDRELQELDLPTLASVRPEFEDLCQRLDVR